MDDWTFIEKTARQMGISEEALRKWRTRGVPPSHRLKIVDAASESGFPLDRSAFDDAPGTRRAQQSAAE